MKNNWHIVYCDKNIDPCPVSEFLEECPEKHQAKIFRFFSLLEDMGPTLPRPYADTIRDGIHELRIKLSGQNARFLYFFCFEYFIVLHIAFFKNTDKIPEQYINDTIKYKEYFLNNVSRKELEKITLE